jgi:tetratricopeptide (TPR) repeat protein
MKTISTIFLFFLLLLCAPLLATQAKTVHPQLDSMLQTLKEPQEKVDAILKFLDEPENQYLPNTDEYALRALEIAQHSSYAAGKIKAMLKLGNYYFRASDYAKAMEFGQKAMGMADDMGFDKELASSLRHIGAIYNELGDYDRSAGYFFKSLSLAEKLKDTLGVAQSLGDIGMDFYGQKEYPKALKYFNNALQKAIQINSLTAIKRQYNNIAVVYQDLHNYDTANVMLRKALAINIKLGDRMSQGLNIMNIGYGQLNKDNFNEALLSFQQSLTLFTELNNRLRMAECYLNIGFTHIGAGRLKEGTHYFTKALQEGQTNGYHIIIFEAAKMLNQIHTSSKDTLTAYKYLMFEKTARDSIFASQKQKILYKLEFQYNYEKKEFERQLAQQTRNTLSLVLIFSLFSGIIILSLFVSRQRLKSRFIFFEKEKVESELDIKNRELTVNLIALIKKNEMLSDISSKLVQLENNARGDEAKKIISQISHELRNRTDDRMLNEFSQRFQEVHAGFYEKLLKSHSDLTPNELKLCAFLRLNMTTKDISELTTQQFTTIDQARYRLRKKLGITNSETNLVTFLSQF